MSRTTGEYDTTVAGGESVRAFVPFPLPPPDPPLDLSGATLDRLRLAEQALARLELAGAMVPSLDWFVYAFVRKEAVISSQSEGTQASLIDLLSFEATQGEPDPSTPNADVEEACNYVDALHFARARLADPQGPPLSMRVLTATHARLLRGARGASKLPGEIRRSQNWIGGSRPGNAMFVPPPPPPDPEHSQRHAPAGRRPPDRRWSEDPSVGSSASHGWSFGVEDPRGGSSAQRERYRADLGA
jgi:hypothetical protein